MKRKEWSIIIYVKTLECPDDTEDDDINFYLEQKIII